MGGGVGGVKVGCGMHMAAATRDSMRHSAHDTTDWRWLAVRTVLLFQSHGAAQLTGTPLPTCKGTPPASVVTHLDNNLHN